jgi:hypothetical protein
MRPSSPRTTESRSRLTAEVVAGPVNEFESGSRRSEPPPAGANGVVELSPFEFLDRLAAFAGVAVTSG